MKKSLILFILLACAGCTTVMIPQYIQDTHPYHKKFYADFDKVLAAVTRVLEDSGWQISRTADPAVFERNKSVSAEGVQQTLLFTQVRSSALILATRYARMNIYLRALDSGTTEAEVRYLTVTSVPLHNFRHYKNDRFVERLFARVEESLEN